MKRTRSVSILNFFKDLARYRLEINFAFQNKKDVKTELVKTQAKYKTQYENEKRMYQKMISGVSPDSKSEKKVSKAKIRNDTTSSYLSYVMAGVAVAALSIGVTMFAKYRNMF